MGRPTVCLEGIMGAGKTTLCLDLARYLDAQVCLEETETAAFQDALRRYYDKPEAHALEFQLFMLERRALRLQWALHEARRGVHGQVVLQDRGLAGDRVIASMHRALGNLAPVEWHLYDALYQSVVANIIPPDCVIFLDIDPREAHRRIQKRARVPELGLPLSYLQLQRDAYEAMLREIARGTHPWAGACVLRVPASPTVCGLGVAWHVWEHLTTRGYRLRPFGMNESAITTTPSEPASTSIPSDSARAAVG